MVKSINKLKDQARSHEQREEWEKAAQLYQQVLRAAEEEGNIAAELGLYNRVGDLYLRLGRGRDAVASYEQAADHYAADGLFNNAIALCNKALRHAPDRLELYRKLGRLSAEQGFFTDARRWFVEFAERSIKRGALDDAFQALGELADLTDDPEIRELLAHQLKAHERTTEAVDELRRAYAARLRTGDQAGAEAVREQLRALDAQAADSLDGTLQAAPSAGGAFAGLPLLDEPGPAEVGAPEAAAAAELPAPEEAPAPAEAAAPPQVAGLSVETAAGAAGLEAEVPEAAAGAPERPEGFAPTHVDEEAGQTSVVIAPALEPAAPAPEEVEPLPFMEVPELEAAETEPAPPPLPLMELEESGAPALEEELPPLPLLELGEEGEEEEEEETAPPPPLPFLEEPGALPGPAEAAGPDADPGPWTPPVEAEPWSTPAQEEPWSDPWAPAAGAEPWETTFPDEPWAEMPPRPAAPAPPGWAPGRPAAPPEQPAPTPAGAEGELTDDVVVLARSLYAHGQSAAGRAAMEQLLADAERSGNQPRKLQLIEALAGLEPDDVAVQQRRVEQAFAVRGPRGAVDALLGLATALERGGVPQRASVVYLQILDIDPSNATAGAALKREKEARPKKPDDGGFVDLGALLLEDEEEREDTTRFTLSETTPTGDEEADFVEMLEQFKEKVAEHMGEDPQAHYDLGLAYKEMGLLDEAVAEFQIALRNGQDRLKVLEELGRCFLLKEEPRIALRLLGQALAVTGRSEMEYMGVNYLLGRCYEDIGEYDAARDAYERIVGLDIQFNDVAERLARL